MIHHRSFISYSITVPDKALSSFYSLVYQCRVSFSGLTWFGDTKEIQPIKTGATSPQRFFPGTSGGIKVPAHMEKQPLKC